VTSSLFGLNDPAELAVKWGTPLYVVSLDQLASNVRRVGACLGDARLLYSMKTNYLPAITRRIRELGLGVDVVSGYELNAALDSGFTGENIIFNGPMKCQEELAFAVRNDVYVNIDGLEEIDHLEQLAAERSSPLPVGLRIYPPSDVYADDPLTPRAVPSKFGWPIADGTGTDIASRIMARSRLRLTGIHCHLGSQITSATALLTVLRPVLDWTARLRSRADITRLDIGGGFGVPGIQRVKGAGVDPRRIEPVPANEIKPDPSFDLAGFSSGLRLLLREYGLDDLEIYAEPGRALVSSAAVLLTRVASLKRLRDHTWVILDGGVNLLPTAGMAERHQLIALRAAAEQMPCLVGGPLCFEGDVFGIDVPLPVDLGIGDLIAIYDAGAYGFSRASSFNKLRAATVVVDEGVPRLAWRAETYSELMRLAVRLWPSGWNGASEISTSAAGMPCNLREDFSPPHPGCGIPNAPLESGRIT
jgi:diaminopimelate decarboxylase